MSNLIPCPECGNLLSRSALVCPKCGFDPAVEEQIQIQEDHLARQEDARRIREEHPEVMNLIVLLFMIPLGVIAWIMFQSLFR